jgi:hypothetical protein
MNLFKAHKNSVMKELRYMWQRTSTKIIMKGEEKMSLDVQDILGLPLLDAPKKYR